jgi:hypothetical protein
LREWLEGTLNDPGFLGAEAWNGRALSQHIRQKQAEGNWTWAECERVWPFLHAYLWRKHFLARNRQSRPRAERAA